MYLQASFLENKSIQHGCLDNMSEKMWTRKKAYKSEKKRYKIKTPSSVSATEAAVMKMEMVKSGRGTSFQNLLQRCL